MFCCVLIFDYMGILQIIDCICIYIYIYECIFIKTFFFVLSDFIIFAPY